MTPSQNQALLQSVNATPHLAHLLGDMSANDDVDSRTTEDHDDIASITP